MYQFVNPDPPSDIITGAQIAIAFLVLFSYPLQAHPCRNSVDKVIPSENDATMSSSRFSAITVSILVLSYLIAITVSDLSLILALVGATGSTAICYILPGLFYYKFSQNMRAVNGTYSLIEILAVGLICLGFVVMFTSLVNIFYGIASSH
jgi:amino acid permease